MKTANKEITTYNVPKALRAKAKTLQSDVAKLIASCATWEEVVLHVKATLKGIRRDAFEVFYKHEVQPIVEAKYKAKYGLKVVGKDKVYLQRSRVFKSRLFGEIYGVKKSKTAPVVKLQITVDSEKWALGLETALHALTKKYGSDVLYCVENWIKENNK